ncbi:MAG: CinA family nicotinamide mononucleotide deamidase-related protein [Shewanella sp.]
MKLEMICTGEEVLSGQIVDTNAAWFANIMMDNGIELTQRVTVGDRLEDLVRVFIERSHHADVILVNGGLGPTSDDLSSLAMAQAIGEPLVENSLWRARIEAWFSQRSYPMPESNLKQAMLPKSAIMVDNPVGTACGFRVKLNRAWLFFSPGVPFEFKQMVKEQFIPFVKSEFAAIESSKVIKLLTLGRGESSLADILEPLPLPAGVSIGYRSSMPYIEIKLFARGDAAINTLDTVVFSVKQLLGDAIVADCAATLAEEVHNHMISNSKTLALAESCTGGLLASQLVAFAGSSAYLHHSLVTYSNESKVKVLGVNPQLLDDFGAVSLETVAAMAQGARTLLDSDYALATSGIAGPDGGSELKPVGTVAIALACGDVTYQQMVKFPSRSRDLVRQMACAVAYDMLRRALKGQEVLVTYPSIRRLA